MKNSQFFAVLVTMLMLVACFTAANAQTFTYAKSSGGFDTETGIDAGKQFTCEGKSFPVFKTAKGSEFVKATSAAGKEYPVWIGNATGLTHDGQPVRQFKSGKYAVFVLNAKGFPRAKYLTEQK